MMYLLDTDHVSLDQRGHQWVMTHIASAGPTQVATTMITVEEQLRGWLAVLRTAKTREARCAAYMRLHATIEYFASSTLVDYDLAADDIYESLRNQKIRVGTQDLRIASIALSRNATLVTRNVRDFNLVSGLIVVDWSLPTS
jgi:tRNA(fMet)-specific endonuclease VapC